MSPIELNPPTGPTSSPPAPEFDASATLAKYANFKGITPLVKEDLRLLLGDLQPTPRDAMGPAFRKIKRSWGFPLANPFGGARWQMLDLLVRCLDQDERWARVAVTRGELRDYGFEISCEDEGAGPTVLYVHFVARGRSTDLFMGHAVRKDTAGTYYFAHHKDGIAEML